MFCDVTPMRRPPGASSDVAFSAVARRLSLLAVNGLSPLAETA